MNLLSRNYRLKSILRSASLFAVMVSVMAPVWSQGTGTDALKGDLENGKERFLALQCWACHGYTGETGPGPVLNPPRFNQAAFIAYVRRPSGMQLSPGPQGTMPPYAGPDVTDQDLADIHAWLVSLPSTSPAAETIPLLKR